VTVASYRKKYASLETEEPVTTAPVETAKLPPATDTPPKLDEPLKESSPVEEAAKSAIQERLDEMQCATEMQSAPPPQRPPQADEPEPPGMQELVQEFDAAIAHLPPRAKNWYLTHPEFLTDPKKAAQIQYAHHIAVRETGEEMTPRYFDAMESLLDLSPPQPKPRREPVKITPPPRGPASSAVNYSAPPSRESPSISTGRAPVSDSKVTLTPEQREAAKYSKCTEEEYAKGVLRMRRERQAGMHRDGQ
jgi:hypothetical protein